MFTDYFQTMPIATNQLNGNYDPKLVVLSYLVAVFASYIALDITGRLRDRGNTTATNTLWLIGGAFAMGAGIWSMHFIGMLSFTIANMQMRYDIFWTVVSLLVVVIISGFALALLKTQTIHFVRLGIGGVILGLGIAAMHYTGMQAMQIEMNVHYMPSLFIVSIIIAIAASEVALWLAIKSNQVVLHLRTRLKCISAAIMGVAICGMHYVGMAAAVFTPLCAPTQLQSGIVDHASLAFVIAGITFIILSVAFFASTYKESLNQQQLESARQLGMAEVSASVLHNVGNVLNSVNVSVGVLTETIAKSKILGFAQLNELLNNHKEDLGRFLTEDPQGTKVLPFINKLAEHLQEERSHLTDELNQLNNNITHIKSIISTQQGLSKISELEQIISMNDLIDEALLITGTGIVKHNVHVEKHYEKIPATLCDKVKALQILVNLIKNAKEALVTSSNPSKTINISTSLTAKKIIIEVKDNGVGIPPENINKIFNYGFTTKQTGHGFGLHTCALTINQMGGEIRVVSEGLDKGTTFTLVFPLKLPV